jgi:NADH pyrophosphatase NudC (nudix superfamily)
MTWKPHLTVAAVVEQNHRFLLVEEETPDGLQFNQPAGHLEESEDIITAVKREVLEETAWHFEPQHIIAVQLWRKKPGSPTFVRVCFTGQCHSHDPGQPLDKGIIACHWLTREEVEKKKQQQRLRSPLVSQSIEDYLNGQRYPLALLKTLLDQDS